MAAYTTIRELHKKRGQGSGMFMLSGISTPSNVTGGSNASGNFTIQIQASTIGSTFPSSLAGVPTCPTPGDPINTAVVHYNCAVTRSQFLARLYKIGTLDLTGTGNKFTHDASVTFPLTRTVYGASSQAINLIPLVYVTTALTTTAAIFRLRNNTGPAAGYTNQAGSGVIGTFDFTFPSTTTAVNSAFIPPLEWGDSGIQDISQIDVTTASATGACTIYGMEILLPLTNFQSGVQMVYDGIVGGMLPFDIRPATPTSGTLTSLLAVVQLGSTTGNNTFNALILDCVSNR